MGILKSAARGLKRLALGRSFGGTFSEKFSKSRANIGSWGEDIASGFGVRTRGARPVLKAGKPAVQSINGGTVTPAEPPVFGSRPLTMAGYASQIGSYGVAGGLLGAHFLKDDETPAKDARGTPNAISKESEMRAKAVDAYRQEKLLGSSGFNQQLYNAVTQDSQWVKTAIDNMGKERYIQLRKAALKDPKYGQAIHDELVTALSKTADTKALAKAVKEPYVLPGVARTKDGKPRIVVISPVKAEKGQQSTYQALQFDWQEPEGQR